MYDKDAVREVAVERSDTHSSDDLSSLTPPLVRCFFSFFLADCFIMLRFHNIHRYFSIKAVVNKLNINNNKRKYTHNNTCIIKNELNQK